MMFPHGFGFDHSHVCAKMELNKNVKNRKVQNFFMVSSGKKLGYFFVMHPKQ